MRIPKIHQIYASFNKLSKREKTVLYVAAIALSLTVLDRLIISPVLSKLRSLDKEIREKQSLIKRSLHILAQKDRILAESAKYDSFLKASPGEEITSVLKEIENLANKNSVYLIDMKPAGSKAGSGYNKYFISLSCEAQMEQIVGFIYDIENSNRLLALERYQFNPKSRESSVVQASLSISKIAVP